MGRKGSKMWAGCYITPGILLASVGACFHKLLNIRTHVATSSDVCSILIDNHSVLFSLSFDMPKDCCIRSNKVQVLLASAHMHYMVLGV